MLSDASFTLLLELELPSFTQITLGSEGVSAVSCLAACSGDLAECIV